MLIASMIHVVLLVEKVSPGKLKVPPCFFLRSEPSLVAQDHDMGPSERVKKNFHV